jgi:hypothetical protein
VGRSEALSIEGITFLRQLGKKQIPHFFGMTTEAGLQEMNVNELLAFALVPQGAVGVG